MNLKRNSRARLEVLVAGACFIAALTLVPTPAALASGSTLSPSDTAPTVPSPEELTANRVVENVNSVADGHQVSRTLDITMTNHKGRSREQTSVSFRKEFEDSRKTVMFFQNPSNIRGTGFLIWNYANPEIADDQWLYLPALRRARRVSNSDRGGYFLGTDFTYEDMKLDGKLEPLDYTFNLLGQEALGERDAIVLEAVAKTPKIAKELGYSRTVSWIDPANWILQKAQFYDLRGELLKTLTVGDIRKVDSIWTRHELTMENHKTGHTTRFKFSNVDYATPVNDRQFSKQALSRGP